MAITYQAFTATAAQTATTLVLTEPAGSTTDDLLVACIAFRGANAPSIPTGWNLILRTSVAGNTTANSSNSIGSGLMAWRKRSSVALTLAERTFGSTTNFLNLSFGYMLRISGQDLTDPIAGSSVNTLVTGAATVTTGAYTRSFTTATANDYIEIMLCMGGQEIRTGAAGAWATQQYITGTTAMTEIAEATSTLGGDGSIAVARSTTLGDTTGGFRAVSDLATPCRSSLMVASFGGPRPAATARSFSVFV